MCAMDGPRWPKVFGGAIERWTYGNRQEQSLSTRRDEAQRVVHTSLLTPPSFSSSQGYDPMSTRHHPYHPRQFDFSIESILSKKPCSTRKKAEESVSGTATSVRVFLQSSGLWRQFHSLGTEMIVTKSGRRMFPTLSVIISGLEPLKSYVVMVDLECIELKRFRYSFHQSKWIATGPGESELPSRMFVHSDSPARGSHWMRAPVSFDKMKLTNNQLDNNGHIIVNSMHKYRPRIHIIEQDDSQKRHTFSFEETEFIAVTAYQNHRITSLKIESNPFAKGFRECEVHGELAGSTTSGGTLQSVFPLIFPYFAHLATAGTLNLSSVTSEKTKNLEN